MKNSRIFLTIITLTLILLVFAGCQGVVPSPSVTDDTSISGKIKMPFTCCIIEENLEEPIGHYTDAWSIVPGARVILWNVEDKCNKVVETITDEDGLYEFKNVKPGLYVVTAYCPVNEDYILKDVAHKKAGIGTNAGIADCESTSLALIIEYLKGCYENNSCFPKSDRSEIYNQIGKLVPEILKIDIPLIEGYANFWNLDGQVVEDYEKLVEMVCDRLEGCCVGPGATTNYIPTRIQYILTLSVEPDGAGTTTGAGTYNSGKTANISAIANDGWKFVGWTGDASGDDANTTVLMNGNKSAVAHFERIPTTYKVTYDGNGNTGGTVPIDSNEYEEGDEVTVLGPGNLVKEGYHFKGWNTEPDGSGDDYDPTDTFNMPAGPVTLYAQWTEDDKYPVTYNNNGGTGSQTDPNSPYYAGAEVTVLDKGDMEKDNHTFKGWNTEPDGSGDDYDPTDTFNMPAGPVTLYAQWTPDECTIKLDEFRVAFEDIPWGKWSGGNCKGDNDFDYEDCVADVEVEGTLIGGLLSQIKFTVDYIHNGAVGLDHKFGLLMPAAFKNQIETAQLNDIDYGAFPADGRFIIFKKGDPGGIYELILTFKSAINYDYYGFDPDQFAHLHGHTSMSVKPFIYIWGNHGKHNIGINNPILLEAGMVGDAGKRVLLMPYKTDWPTNDGTVIWECFTDGVEQDRCYPKFTKPVKDWKKIGSW